MKDVIQNPPTTKEDVRIIKIATCPSVSNKSALTYHVGCTEDGDIQLRIWANTAAGFFSKEWLPLKTIEETLTKGGPAFTSFALLPLFRGKSQNNTAFLLAVLLHEKLIGPSPDKKRAYTKIDAGRFLAEIKALIESETSLKEDDKPKPKTDFGSKTKAKPSKTDSPQ